jgi:hypothetical protein
MIAVLVVTGIAAAYWLAERWRQNRAWRRLMLYVYTQQPFANTAAPTTAELRRPDWINYTTN